MGNIKNRTVAGTSETYAYDPNHPYAVGSVTNMGGGTYSASYDPDGNMTSRNGYQIQWTPSNLPSSMGSALGSSTFSYDPDHARYYQSATFNSVTTDTTYVGGLFEVVSSSKGTTEYRHNIVADGQAIAVHTITGTGAASTSYLHYDHLGSVDAITGDQGSVIQSMSFDAFGLRRDPNNWDYDLSQNTIATLKNYTDRGYTDQEQLDNLSLVDLNGRVYDPTVGRMISADPTVPVPFYSQAFNRFAYVYDSPLEATDPTGFVCKANTGTEVCNEMDGGSTGYFSGGGTGNAGADQPGGSGDVWANLGDSNDNSDPNQSIQITPLGRVHVFGFRPIPIASLLWWMNPCFTCSLPGSFFNPLATPTQQNQGAQSSGGDNAQQPTQSQTSSTAKCMKQAAAFISANSAYADEIQQQTSISATNLLGLAALESNFGTSNLATTYNNYFGLTVGPAYKGTVGTYNVLTTGYTFGVYPSPGFLTSGLSFAQSFQGARVAGIDNSLVFAKALTTPPKAFNSEPGYAGKLVTRINQVTACQ